MKSKLISLLSLLLLVGCGENFQGTYSGTALLVRDSCGASGGTYNMELKTVLSGGSFDFIITRLDPTTGGASLPSVIEGVNIQTELQNDIIFYTEMVFENVEGATLIADGRISSDRSVIDNLQLTFTGPTTDGFSNVTRQNCQLVINANSLRLLNKAGF